MTRKIGLISDVHATPAPLAEALSIFRREKVDTILCAGDITGYGKELEQTIDLLQGNDCKTVSGNHDIWYLDQHLDQLTENPAAPSSDTMRYLSTLPSSLEFEFANTSVYMVHASPPSSNVNGIKLLDADANLDSHLKNQWSSQLAGFHHDLLIVGHTHQVFAEQLADTLVVNPGSTKFNHSCAILTFPDLKFNLFALSNRAVLRTWNWGLVDAEPGEECI
jgi:putative phosphoesterase